MREPATQERATLSLLRETAAWTGEQFAAELVARLGRRFEALLVLAGRLETADERWIRPVAVVRRGAPIPPTPYRLRGAPCEVVVEQGPLQVRDGLVDRFPDDAMLRELHAVCYVGQPIRAPNGQTVGVLAALFDHPRDLDVDEAAVLEICAARLGAEFEREDAQCALHRSIEAASRGRIAGEVAQEFSNLLTAMQGNLEQLADAGRDEQAEILAELRLATAAMIERTAVLLDRHESRPNGAVPIRSVARQDVDDRGRTAPAPECPRTAHVVLADGDDLVRRACHRSLRPLGAELLEAHCADRLFELLDAVPATDPVAVLLDAHLPDRPLAQVLAELRQRRADAEVLLMTGLGHLSRSAATVERRIAKPFSAVALRVAVGEALQASRVTHGEPAVVGRHVQRGSVQDRG